LNGGHRSPPRETSKLPHWRHIPTQYAIGSPVVAVMNGFHRRPVRYHVMRIFFRFITLLFAFSAFTIAAPGPAAAQVDVGISVTVPPPALPVYAQPVVPGPGYIWIPGYWAWGGPDGYYWVPGTWVLPPEVGLLWTPGYWAWGNGVYLWHAGYWGPRVGFYGGIVYGFGYDGIGYHGGFWQAGHFHYNTVVNNIGNVHVTYVYRRTVVTDVHVTHVSFNGGHGGSTARPTAQQQAFAQQHHVGPTEMQRRHDDQARGDRDLRSSVNHGQPPIAATPRAAAFTDRGVIGAGRPQQHAAPHNAPHAAAPAVVTGRPPEPHPQPGHAPQHVETPHHAQAQHTHAPQHGQAPPAVHPAHSPAAHAPAHPQEAPRGGPPPHSEAQHAPKGGPHGESQSDAGHGHGHDEH